MEIGSIFDIDIEHLFRERKNNFYLPFMENTLYQSINFFNTGRSAIEYVLKEQFQPSIEGKVLLPAFNCSSVVEAVKRSGVDYEFYAITKNFQIDIEDIKKKLNGNVKCLYIIQYFGSYQNESTYEFLEELQSKNISIIEDISLSLYSKHEKYIGFGDYILGSIRKWLPIPDGAFLCSKHYMPMKNLPSGYNEYAFKYFTAQIMKNKYLKQGELDKEKFLKINNEAMTSLFSDYTIRSITDVSMDYLCSYDINEVIHKRRKNYKHLLEGTKELSFLKPFLLENENHVPFGFIIQCEKRDQLLKYLIANSIYCNVHWNILEECAVADSIAQKLSKQILTIPCDQRYGEVEMEYIINTLKNFEIKKETN